MKFQYRGAGVPFNLHARFIRYIPKYNSNRLKHKIGPNFAYLYPERIEREFNRMAVLISR